ncbi:MAG TPA: PTS sugar transporter, partial [Clostridiaceae bacterium]|nr:PTS sugar transporter [Clostridiaceae bacterium]
KQNKKAVSGLLLGIAFTSFLTGITEPIEFSFMFLAPGLYLAHAVLSGIALAVTEMLGIKCGFGFSAGLIDYILNFGISTKPVLLIFIGLIFGVIYYFVFVYAIKKFNLPTPGRLDEDVSTALSGLTGAQLKEKAAEILNAIGGKTNIDSLDACITRIRLTAKDGSKIDEAALKRAGASGVMKMGSNNFQIVVGTVADPLATHMKTLMR